MSITSKTGTKLNWINFVMLKVFGTLFSVNVRVYMYVCVFVCVCMYLCMYVYSIYLCIYLNPYFILVSRKKFYTPWKSHFFLDSVKSRLVSNLILIVFGKGPNV